MSRSNASGSHETPLVFYSISTVIWHFIYIHIQTHSIRGFLQPYSTALLTPTPTSFTYMSTTLKICKVNIRNEKDWLGVQIHKRLEDGDVCTFVWGKHWHFDIRNCIGVEINDWIRDWSREWRRWGRWLSYTIEKAHKLLHKGAL